MKNIYVLFLAAILVGSSFVIIGNNNAYAQIISDEIEFASGPILTGTSSTSEGADEITASSGSNRFVVSVDFIQGGSGEIMFRQSMDNGATWKSTVNLSTNPGRSDLPRIAVSGSNLYVVWNQANVDNDSKDIFFRRSLDNGATWGPKVKLSTSSSGSPELFDVMANVVGSGSNVYVTWDGPSGVFLRRSTDNGASWKSPTPIGSGSGQVPPAVIAAGSNVYLAWAGEVNLQFDALFRRSTDNGATWKPTINLSNNAGDSWGPQLTVSGSNVYVTWVQFNQIHDAGDIFIKRSTDNGASWKARINLSNTGEVFEAPRMAISGSNVHVAWVAYGRDNTFLIFRGSADSGTTWKSSITLKTTGVFGIGSGIDIAASGANVYVMWFQRESSNPTDVYIRRSTDSGATWKSIKNLSSNGDRSGFEIDLAVSGSIVYVAWWDTSPTSGGLLYRRSTDNGASWEGILNLGSPRGLQIAV